MYMYQIPDKSRTNRIPAISSRMYRKDFHNRFEDNRPEAVQMKKIQTIADRHTSPWRLLIQKKNKNKPDDSSFYGANKTLQCRSLTPEEQRLSKEVRIRLQNLKIEYLKDKKNIQTYFQITVRMKNESIELQNSIEENIPRLDFFFENATSLAQQAVTSVHAVRELTKQLNWYEYSGGKNVIDNLLNALKKRILSTSRINVMDIMDDDEEYFNQYMSKAPHPPITVYRGEGRGVNSQSLNSFRFQDIIPYGEPDISFRGVAEHVLSNTSSNGMISTSTNFDIAHGFATDKHKYGFVYEITADKYIDVVGLLRKRNFKHYSKQAEILIPGIIPASNIKSVTLYKQGESTGTKKENS